MLLHATADAGALSLGSFNLSSTTVSGIGGTILVVS